MTFMAPTMLPLRDAEEKSGKNAAPLVLIADPEVPTAHLLRGVFEYEGYQVVMAQNAARVFEQIAARAPDLIILETRLGKTSGFDVLRRLREDPATSAIPTFLLTTSADWPDILQGLELGADDTMRKPVHPRELLARAQSKIKSRHLEEALQRRTRDLEAVLRVSEVLNEHHDWQVLPPLVLAMMYDLLPLDSAALVVFNEGGRVERLSAYPEPTYENVKQWVQLFAPEVRLLSAAADLEGLSNDTDIGSAVALPLGYLENASGKAFLVAFSGHMLDVNEVQLMAGIGRQADLALRNAELYRLQADYAQQLEIKVAERTSELQSTQNQLIQAEKLATVGRLAAGIAHEINNPLMPIKINLESILEDIQMGREVEEDMVTATLESVDRIRRLVQRLLEYNAGQATSPDAMQPLNLNEVVEAVQELTRKAFKQNGMQIILDLHPLKHVVANRDALTQVFINLALNAADAMDSGGTLTIATRQMKDAAQVTFKDTGSGIPPEMLDRIFDPFMTTKTTGSGLGLFVSYGIIEGHHGTIKVSSTPREGTTFTITLPVAPSRG